VQLYYSPASCAISPHIILEEIGQPYDAIRVLTKQGGTKTPSYLKLNPKGKVPVLVLDDGSIVTETPVVLQFLATVYPQHALLPANRCDLFAALQVCEYLSNTVHTFGLTRLVRPRAFCSSEAYWDEIRLEGSQVLQQAFGLLAQRLEDQPLLFEEFSIADASLFFFELHASRLQIAMPAAVKRHFDQLLNRPSVRAVMASEGLIQAEWVPAASPDNP
jgi:glutathione S-transferase